jgi:Fe2+ or Zn2+ uptake regulation protein
MNPEPWLAQLHENGYRITAARRAVVETIAGTQRALTPVEVYDEARRAYRALGLVTVYRTLERLEQQGLIQRVHQPLGCQAFLPAAQGHQHLLLCRACGQAAFFEGEDLEAFIKSIARKTGYQITDHWFQLFGLCTDCRPH